MLDNTRKWVYQTTQVGNTSPKGSVNAFSTTRDSKKIAFKWRVKTNSTIVQIVEKHCGSVMKRLGYKFTGTSLEKQLNLNISLIFNRYNSNAEKGQFSIKNVRFDWTSGVVIVQEDDWLYGPQSFAHANQQCEECFCAG